LKQLKNTLINVEIKDIIKTMTHIDNNISPFVNKFFIVKNIFHFTKKDIITLIDRKDYRKNKRKSYEWKKNYKKKNRKRV